jgi:hypothetical protein
MGKPSPHIESGTGAVVALPPDEPLAPDDEPLAPDDELPAEVVLPVVLQYVGSSMQTWLSALPCGSEPFCNSSAGALDCEVCAWALGDSSVNAIRKPRMRIAIKTPTQAVKPPRFVLPFLPPFPNQEPPPAAFSTPLAESKITIPCCKPDRCDR